MTSVLIFVLLLMNYSFASKLSSDEVVDFYIQLAKKSELKDLQDKKGDYRCYFPISHQDESYFSYGKNLEEAVQKLQLVCIKDQCNKIGQYIQEGMEILNEMSNEELRDFLEFAGISPEQIEGIVSARSNQPHDFGSLTCDRASPAHRSFAFDLCFSSPVQCELK